MLNLKIRFKGNSLILKFLCLYADNTVYDGICKYEAVLLTREPYDEGFDKLLLFNHSRLLSSRQVAGINEFTFTIYF